MQLFDSQSPPRLLHGLRALLSTKGRGDAKLVGGRGDQPGDALAPMQSYLFEVHADFLEPFSHKNMMAMSRALKMQFRERLQSDTACMLPSYNDRLATGREKGRYVALDLGGSTFRVAIIELTGRQEDAEELHSRIAEMKLFRVGREVKDLIGTSFFDWMAARIVETVRGNMEGLKTEDMISLPLALTWSFPVEQTSLRSGRLQPMGKGFRAADGLTDQDLGTLVEAACLRAGLTANVHILLNDSGATLISQTYTHPSTRFGLILGTGVNVAGYLPTHLISKDKFGQRPEGWLEEAHSVIVNAELSMFGHGILPRTQWDAKLSSSLPRPEFQPLETMVSGMYLGEIARLVLVDAIEATGLFGGATPKAFQQPYSLGTEVLSMIEENDFTMFETALAGSSAHTMTTPDRSFLRSLAGVISQRSAAIVAVSIHAMWELRQEALEEQTVAPYWTGKADLELEQTIVAFTGSVIESYPGYLDKCQRLVDDLVADGSGDQVDRSRRVRFVPAKESSLLGAGVALVAAIEN